MRIYTAWYDMWIGAFWDRKKRILYICPLPCVVIEIPFARRLARRPASTDSIS